MTERIVESAVKTKGGVVITGYRHHTIRDFMRDELWLDRWEFIWAKQGFVTNTGRFVDRVEGWKIALAANQIDDIETRRGIRELFSEDVGDNYIQYRERRRMK
jgi:hypothetical protein